MPRETDPTLSGEDSPTFASDNQLFALALYAELGKQPGNLFYSPYAGAKGYTATQMADTLHSRCRSRPCTARSTP